MKDDQIYHRKRTENVESSVHTIGDPGNGGAHFQYRLKVINNQTPLHDYSYTRLSFQQGHMDVEINGLLEDQLLAVVAHRLRAFQAGPFACDENARTLSHVEAAMACIDERVNRRTKQGIQGLQKETTDE